MKIRCLYCCLSPDVSDYRTCVVRRGHFKRKNNSQTIRRYQCKRCKKHFSSSLFTNAYRQNKRHKNEPLRMLLASNVSLRRSAEILHLSRTTVARKLIFLGRQNLERLKEFNANLPKASCVEFDDQETFEHTKCKPLSVTLAVEQKTRRVLAFEISQMSCNGRLAEISRKKYGPRPDKRKDGRRKVFQTLTDLVTPNALFKSDENPHYPASVSKHFPLGVHKTFKGQRGSETGQGELKKVKFDPLFSMNHTFAMSRANVNRLIRKTWCTTKLRQNLVYHLAIFAVFHNERLNLPSACAVG